MKLKASVTLDEFTPKARNVGARSAMRAEGMRASVGLIEQATTAFTPVGVTGQLASSWQPEIDARGAVVDGVVGSPLVWAAVIERGRGAGEPMPPPDELEAWVAVKLGDSADAFVVARAIGRKGFAGRKMLASGISATAGARAAIWATLAREGLNRS